MNVYPKKMLKNLNITKGLIFSQRVMIELTKRDFLEKKLIKWFKKMLKIHGKKIYLSTKVWRKTH